MIKIQILIKIGIAQDK